MNIITIMSMGKNVAVAVMDMRSMNITTTNTIIMSMGKNVAVAVIDMKSMNIIMSMEKVVLVDVMTTKDIITQMKYLQVGVRKLLISILRKKLRQF